MADRFGGVTIKNGEIRHKDGSGPLAGAHASVDSAGDLDRRITATRLILTGPFALALRKKKDQRELYLLVEGQGFAIVEQIDPKKGVDARKFAARLNTLASQAATSQPQVTQSSPLQPPAPPPRPTPPPPPPPVPAAWSPDPLGRHELRYWDGTRWTEHVSNGGAQGIDPI